MIITARISMINRYMKTKISNIKEILKSHNSYKDSVEINWTLNLDVDVLKSRMKYIFML